MITSGLLGAAEVVPWPEVPRALVMGAVKNTRALRLCEGYLLGRPGSGRTTSTRYVSRDPDSLGEHLRREALRDPEQPWHKMRILKIEYSREGYSYLFSDWHLDGTLIGSWRQSEWRDSILRSRRPASGA